MMEDLAELCLEDTLQYDPYEDESFKHRDITLKIGDKMCDADGKPIDKSNHNLIFEICLYEV